jgi:hypothetical protein
MDVQAIIRIGLEEYLDGLRKALHGLTAAERRFQPKADANHIDFVVWHNLGQVATCVGCSVGSNIRLHGPVCVRPRALVPRRCSGTCPAKESGRIKV